jgi:epoxyqueuosine reductase
MDSLPESVLATLHADVGRWARELGFDALGITDLDLRAHGPRLQSWLDAQHHGSMGYLARNLDKRLEPVRLTDGVLRAIVVRMNYLPEGENLPLSLEDRQRGYIARYATGRDYHKVMRRRLAVLAERLSHAIAPHPHGYRVFTDSAPVLERALAVKAGLGWVGRNSMVIDADAGSWFFIGEILTNLPLPVDPPDDADRCGACRACLRVCPTDAILPDRTLDARRCVSYLTIENKGAIPEAFRTAIGNRVFGCDDCQIWCPWNRDAAVTTEPDFRPRAALLDRPLDELFAMDEAAFLAATEGSALRRIGYEQWQRNLAVALGNSTSTPARIAMLTKRLETATPLIAEHLLWAIDQLSRRNESR